MSYEEVPPGKDAFETWDSQAGRLRVERQRILQRAKEAGSLELKRKYEMQADKVKSQEEKVRRAIDRRDGRRGYLIGE